MMSSSEKLPNSKVVKKRKTNGEKIKKIEFFEEKQEENESNMKLEETVEEKFFTTYWSEIISTWNKTKNSKINTIMGTKYLNNNVDQIHYFLSSSEYIDYVSEWKKIEKIILNDDKYLPSNLKTVSIESNCMKYLSHNDSFRTKKYNISLFECIQKYEFQTIQHHFAPVQHKEISLHKFLISLLIYHKSVIFLNSIQKDLIKYFGSTTSIQWNVFFESVFIELQMDDNITWINHKIPTIENCKKLSHSLLKNDWSLKCFPFFIIRNHRFENSILEDCRELGKKIFSIKDDDIKIHSDKDKKKVSSFFHNLETLIEFINGIQKLKSFESLEILLKNLLCQFHIQNENVILPEMIFTTYDPEQMSCKKLMERYSEVDRIMTFDIHDDLQTETFLNKLRITSAGSNIVSGLNPPLHFKYPLSENKDDIFQVKPIALIILWNLQSKSFESFVILNSLALENYASISLKNFVRNNLHDNDLIEFIPCFFDKFRHLCEKLEELTKTNKNIIKLNHDFFLKNFAFQYKKNTRIPINQSIMMYLNIWSIFAIVKNCKDYNFLDIPIDSKFLNSRFKIAYWYLDNSEKNESIYHNTWQLSLQCEKNYLNADLTENEKMMSRLVWQGGILFYSILTNLLDVERIGFEKTNTHLLALEQYLTSTNEHVHFIPAPLGNLSCLLLSKFCTRNPKDRLSFSVIFQHHYYKTWIQEKEFLFQTIQFYNHGDLLKKFGLEIDEYETMETFQEDTNFETIYFDAEWRNVDQSYSSAVKIINAFRQLFLRVDDLESSKFFKGRLTYKINCIFENLTTMIQELGMGDGVVQEAISLFSKSIGMATHLYDIFKGKNCDSVLKLEKTNNLWNNSFFFALGCLLRYCTIHRVEIFLPFPISFYKFLIHGNNAKFTLTDLYEIDPVKAIQFEKLLLEKNASNVEDIDLNFSDLNKGMSGKVTIDNLYYYVDAYIQNFFHNFTDSVFIHSLNRGYNVTKTDHELSHRHLWKYFSAPSFFEPEKIIQLLICDGEDKTGCKHSSECFTKLHFFKKTNQKCLYSALSHFIRSSDQELLQKFYHFVTGSYVLHDVDHENESLLTFNIIVEIKNDSKLPSVLTCSRRLTLFTNKDKVFPNKDSFQKWFDEKLAFSIHNSPYFALK